MLGLLAVVLAGGFMFRDQLGLGGAEAPTAVQAAPQALGVGAADIDLVATELARRLIAEGELPPPEAATQAAPHGVAESPQPQAGVEAAAVSAVPRPPVLAPVVRRPALPPDAPVPATPAPAPAAETEQAVRQVLAQAPAEVRAAIADGRQVIYTLHVLDDVEQDGDVVEVFVNGVSYGRIMLTSLGQDLLVPLPAGSTAQVHVVALEDGGGGVTFGVHTSMGEIRTAVMAVGQSQDWSVTVQ
jgi:hypothetical protein